MFDGLKQCFEISFSEAPTTFPLDEFKENRRPVLHWLGKELQQVTVLIPVGQDTQLGDGLDSLVDFSDAPGKILVIRFGYT